MSRRTRRFFPSGIVAFGSTALPRPFSSPPRSTGRQRTVAPASAASPSIRADARYANGQTTSNQKSISIRSSHRSRRPAYRLRPRRLTRSRNEGIINLYWPASTNRERQANPPSAGALVKRTDDLATSTRGSRSIRRILDAAARMFGQDGFQGASMGAVAEAAGVSKGLLHYHFQSKEHLLIEAVRATFRQLHRRFDDRFRRGERGLETALDALDALWAAVREMQAWAPFMVETMSLATKNEALREDLFAFYAESSDLLEKGIGKCSSTTRSSRQSGSLRWSGWPSTASWSSSPTPGPTPTGRRSTVPTRICGIVRAGLPNLAHGGVPVIRSTARRFLAPVQRLSPVRAAQKARERRRRPPGRCPPVRHVRSSALRSRSGVGQQARGDLPQGPTAGLEREGGPRRADRAGTGRSNWPRSNARRSRGCSR